MAASERNYVKQQCPLVAIVKVHFPKGLRTYKTNSQGKVNKLYKFLGVFLSSKSLDEQREIVAEGLASLQYWPVLQ